MGDSERKQSIPLRRSPLRTSWRRYLSAPSITLALVASVVPTIRDGSIRLGTHADFGGNETGAKADNTAPPNSPTLVASKAATLPDPAGVSPGERASSGSVSIIELGAIPNDNVDDTAAIFAAARQAKCASANVLLPQGTYLFQISDDPRSLPGDHRHQVWRLTRDYIVPPTVFPSRNEMHGRSFNCLDDPIMGVQHNFLELKVDDLYQGENKPLRRILIGDFKRPPLAQKRDPGPVEFAAFWWSRFGTDYLAQWGPCATYDAFTKPWLPKCKLSDGTAHSMYGPADYTWEWAHQSGPRASERTTIGGITRQLRRDITLRLDVDYPAAYDPQRHPLLGWYRDDDPIISDWISFWLREYGITLLSIADGAWTTPLFSGIVPNFSQLKFHLWFPTDLTPILRTRIERCIETAGDRCPRSTFELFSELWMDTFERKVFPFANFHRVIHEGREYPALFLFKPQALRKSLGSRAEICKLDASDRQHPSACWTNCENRTCGLPEIEEFLSHIAEEMKNRGFGGLAVFARQGHTDEAQSERLATANVIYLETRYAAHEEVLDRSPSDSYSSLSSKVTSEWNYERYRTGNLTVSTAGFTYPPHHNKLAFSGSTPKQFEEWLIDGAKRLIDYQNTGLPQVITPPILFIYNVSEWLEAGPGLQPNLQDGYGYLTAVGSAIEAAKSYAFPRSQ